MLRRVPVLTCLLVLLVGLAACSEPNPVIGVWVVDTEASATGGKTAADLSGIAKIEFRDDKMVIGSTSVDVSYEIAGNRVIVTESAEGRGEVYTIIDDDHLQKKGPMGIDIFYEREGTSTPEVTTDHLP